MPSTLSDFQVPKIASCDREGKLIKIAFEDGENGRLPFLWLRDNCRCTECYDFVAIARLYSPIYIKMDVEPTKIWLDSGQINITWTDGHQSVYDSEWLYEKGISFRPKSFYKTLKDLEKIIPDQFCDPTSNIFDYKSLLESDRILLRWLKTVEERGIAVIKNGPVEQASALDLLRKVAYPKMMQFGLTCPVTCEKNRPIYVSHTNRSLGFHTDTCYYEKPGGILIIFFVKQTAGEGGENLFVDGFSVAEFMRKNHPEEFEMLTKTQIYFCDREEIKSYTASNRHKMNKTPIIKLDNEGKLFKITYSNHKRDAAIDLPQDKVLDYYKAYKIFSNLVHERATIIKMQTGDIVTMDNFRMLHARKGFQAESERQLEVSYLDWDEAKSKRRCLQVKFRDQAA